LIYTKSPKENPSPRFFDLRLVTRSKSGQETGRKSILRGFDREGVSMSCIYEKLVEKMRSVLRTALEPMAGGVLPLPRRHLTPGLNPCLKGGLKGRMPPHWGTGTGVVSSHLSQSPQP
jgi:hypothetical protein